MQQRTPMGVFASSRPCRCRGTGRIIRQPCTDCGGRGLRAQAQDHQGHHSAGIDHGQTISLRGDRQLCAAERQQRRRSADHRDGAAGRGVPPGGCGRVLQRPSPLHRPRWAPLEIPTIDEKVKYDLPEGADGQRVPSAGKGIPVLNGRGRGDQYVTVSVETPRNLTRGRGSAADVQRHAGRATTKRKSFFRRNEQVNHVSGGLSPFRRVLDGSLTVNQLAEGSGARRKLDGYASPDHVDARCCGAITRPRAFRLDGSAGADYAGWEQYHGRLTIRLGAELRRRRHHSTGQRLLEESPGLDFVIGSVHMAGKIPSFRPVLH